MKKYSPGKLKERFSELGIQQTDIAEEMRRDFSEGNSNNKERVLRAVSWLSAAEKQRQCGNQDMHLMCVLVAFNALYAVPPQKTAEKTRPDERVVVNEFITKLVNVDKDRILEKFLKEKEDEFVNAILNHQYLFRLYWNFSQKNNWDEEYEKGNAKAREALAGGDIVTALDEILSRVRVLRNQILHGEAGFNDYYNRTQVKLCADFMQPLTGRMTAVIMDNFDINWGTVPFAPQGGKPDAPTDRPHNLAKK